MKTLTPDNLMEYLRSRFSDKPVIIAIGGKGSSGKTEFLRKIARLAKDDELDVIFTDSFGYEIDLRREKGVTGGHPEALDKEKLIEVFKKIHAGESFPRPPPYGHNQESFPEFSKSETYSPKTLNIVEGIGALFTPLLEHYDLSIFIDCKPDEEFRRRLERDVKIRKRPLDDIKTAFNTRMEQFDKHVTPRKENCDFVVESQPDYSLNIIKCPPDF